MSCWPGKQNNLPNRFTCLALEPVATTSKDDAELWVNVLLGHGLAQDVIGLDHDAWMQLPAHPSAIWRGVARDAQPLLEEPR